MFSKTEFDCKGRQNSTRHFKNLKDILRYLIRRNMLACCDNAIDKALLHLSVGSVFRLEKSRKNKNSTSSAPKTTQPIALTSGFGCRTSGIFIPWCFIFLVTIIAFYV